MKLTQVLGGYEPEAMAGATPVGVTQARTTTAMMGFSGLIHFGTASLAATTLGAPMPVAVGVGLLSALTLGTLDQQLAQVAREQRGDIKMRKELGLPGPSWTDRLASSFTTLGRVAIALVAAGVLSVGTTLFVAQADIDQWIARQQLELDAPAAAEAERQYAVQMATVQTVANEHRASLTQFDEARARQHEAELAGSAAHQAREAALLARETELRSMIDVKRRELSLQTTRVDCEDLGSQSSTCLGPGSVQATGTGGQGEEWTFATRQVAVLKADISTLTTELGEIVAALQAAASLSAEDADPLAGRQPLVERYDAAMAAVRSLQEGRDAFIADAVEAAPNREVLDPRTIYNRITALGELTEKSPHFATTILFIELLAFAAECLILLTEVSSRRASSYDLAVAKRERAYLRSVITADLVDEETHLDLADVIARKRSDATFRQAFSDHLAQRVHDGNNAT